MSTEEAETRAIYHDRQVRRIEELLKIPDLPKTSRDLYQRRLIQHAGAAHALRNPPAPNENGRMKSFVGSDSYEWNG